MAVEQDGREQEVEGANKRANNTCECVDVYVVACISQAQFFAKSVAFTAEPVFGSLVHRDDVRCSVDDDLDPNRNHKKHEGIVIFDANTIVDPRAMVIKSLYALIAN